MEVKVQAKYIRTAPRKARLIAGIIRKMPVVKAIEQLTFLNKKAARMILTAVNSGVANAENNFELKRDNLFIKTIQVNEGPALKRWMPKAMGRATPIKKKTSHVIIILDEITPTSAEKKTVGKSAEKVEKAKRAPKQEALETVGEVVNDENSVVSEALTDEKGQEIIDVRMQGKHRNKQNLDRKSKKDKGFLKKIFQRKSG